MTEGLISCATVIAIFGFGASFALVMRAMHLTGPGYILVAAFVAAGIALVMERRTRG